VDAHKGSSSRRASGAEVTQAVEACSRDWALTASTTGRWMNHSEKKNANTAAAA
jgi:hypothetical protein